MGMEYSFENAWKIFAKKMLARWRPSYESIADQIPCPNEQLRKLLALQGGARALEMLDQPVPKFGGRIKREVLQTEDGMNAFKEFLMELPEEYWDVWVEEMKASLAKGKK